MLGTNSIANYLCPKKKHGGGGSLARTRLPAILAPCVVGEQQSNVDGSRLCPTISRRRVGLIGLKAVRRDLLVTNGHQDQWAAPSPG